MNNSKTTRVLVDEKVRALAAQFLDNYEVIPSNGLTWDDAVWDLAGEIQIAIENWITDEEDRENIRERR